MRATESGAEGVGRVGILGAGTMGAGIAQVAIMGGVDVVLHDPVPAALAAGVERLRGALDRGTARGRWSQDDVDVALARLSTGAALADLAACDLVIEAGPEDLPIKREIFRDLSAVCADDTVLATNTSSIPIAAIAQAATHPERVVGMHFFNPVPAMRLVEVIAARQSAPWAVQRARAAGVAFGKTVILPTDGPGFLVNRCGRPYYTEALRIIDEHVAPPEQVDRICRMGGGFRMGPFELKDLVGLDVEWAVARSFWEGSNGEPRWRPSVTLGALATAGLLGRKSGRGWYDYSGDEPWPADPAPPEPGSGPAIRVAVLGDGPVAARVRGLAEAAGHTVAGAGEADLTILADGADPAAEADVRLCASRSLIGQGRPEAVGFSLLAEPADARIVELARTSRTPDAAAASAEAFFASLGLHVEWTQDGPGLVLARIAAAMVNEGCFAVGEGIGSADDVDTGTQLGLNYPRGPMTWGAALGWAAVLETIDGLWEERREERHRAAPLLRSAALLGDLG